MKLPSKVAVGARLFKRLMERNARRADRMAARHEREHRACMAKIRAARRQLVDEHERRVALEAWARWCDDLARELVPSRGARGLCRWCFDGRRVPDVNWRDVRCACGNNV